MKRLRFVRDEGGFSLVFTLLTMLVTAVTLTSIVQYTTSNSRTSTRSKADQIAYSLAEAGLANGAAVLSNPSNNALDPTVLPSSEPDPANPAHANYIAQYDGGTVKWWGVLTGHQWIMHGVGLVTDPTGKTRVVRREVTSTIKIQPSLAQQLNSNVWNFMFARDTSSACDVTLENSVQIDASMYILGDLCFKNSSSIVNAGGTDITNLYVGEHVFFDNSSSGAIGTVASKINQAQIVLGCRVHPAATWTTPCTDATRVNATTIVGGPPLAGTGPVADFDFWYANAKPGPTQFCGTGHTGMSIFAFESSGSTTRNNSASSFNLTPASNYSCKFYDVAPNNLDVLGELTWDNATKLLTVKGVVYIDGNAHVSNGATNRYDGLATLYVTGTFAVGGNSQLCGGVTGGNCDFATWNPNADNLGIIADGRTAAGLPGAVGSNTITMGNAGRFQGSLYATNAVEIGQSAQYDGPMVAGTFKLAQSVQTHEFPTITTVPIGWPGNPNVYLEPQPPKNYSG